MARRVVCLAVAFSGVVLGVPTSATACSCIGIEVGPARDAAVAVFEGEVIQIIIAPSGHEATLVMRLSRVWKGTPLQEVRIPIQHPSMCPPHFQVGERFIVYASGTVDALEIANCSRWVPPTQIRAERRALGRPIHRF